MKTIKIGRSKECDIVLTYDKISRIHAIMSYDGSHFIFRDVSKNGSSVNGRFIMNDQIIVQPDTPITLAGKVLLPWDQVYIFLPRRIDSAQITGYSFDKRVADADNQLNRSLSRSSYSNYSDRDALGVGWGILAFLIPLAGFIMYFSWRETTPNRARLAGLIGLISFGLTFLTMV